MPTAPKTLDDLFLDTLKDVYFAEKTILATLPKLAEAAQLTDLNALFEKHFCETERQIHRLEAVFAIINSEPQGRSCASIVGLAERGRYDRGRIQGFTCPDAGLLSVAQAVEHYEIARYGTLIAWAEELGLDDAVTLLDETLEEEEATDETLAEIEKTAVNQQAHAA